jgi:uncharacterized protein YdcH (DUF465 family)
MIHRISNIIGRFPEDENAIRELMRSDPKFDALCEEYASISKELEQLTQMKGQDVTAKTTALRKQLVAIEEEVLTVIEGYRPV